MLTHRFKTILGNIPADWGVVSLRECIVRQETVAGSWGEDEGEISLRVLRSTNFTNDGHLTLGDIAVRWFPAPDVDCYKLQRHDILVERSGGSPDQPVGRVVILGHDMPGFGFGNFIQRLRPRPDTPLLPQFLYYCLFELHRTGVVERLQFQTTQMRNLDYRDYIRVLLPRPPEDEQQEIVRLINTADSLLQTAKRLLGVTASLHREDMQGPVNRLKTSLLQHLVVGRVRVKPDVSHA